MVLASNEGCTSLERIPGFLKFLSFWIQDHLLQEIVTHYIQEIFTRHINQFP